MDSKYNIVNKNGSFRNSFNTQGSSSGSGQNNSFGHNSNNNNNNNGKIMSLKRKNFSENGSNGNKKFRLDRALSGKTMQEQRRALPVFHVKDQ